jgi:hypothetical protein
VTDSKAAALAIRQSIGVEKLGEIMYKSGFFDDARSQAQAIVKILAGAELDFGPVASMNGIYIVKGRISLAANLVAAAIQRSGRYRYRVLEHTDQTCTIEFYEKVDGKWEAIGTSTFDMEDAKVAGLAGTENWRKFPRNMLFSRALTNGARWSTPDVFNGPVYSPEELGAEVNEEGAPLVEWQPPEAPEERYVPTQEREVEDAPRATVGRGDQVVSSADDRLWKRWLEVRDEGLKYGVNPPELRLPVGRNQLVSQATLVKAQTEAKQARLQREDDARSEGSAWETNKALMAEAYAAGLRLKELPSRSTIEEVVARNAEILEMLRDRQT